MVPASNCRQQLILHWLLYCKYTQILTSVPCAHACNRIFVVIVVNNGSASKNTPSNRLYNTYSTPRTDVAV